MRKSAAKTAPRTEIGCDGTVTFLSRADCAQCGKSVGGKRFRPRRRWKLSAASFGSAQRRWELSASVRPVAAQPQAGSGLCQRCFQTEFHKLLGPVQQLARTDKAGRGLAPEAVEAIAKAKFAANWEEISAFDATEARVRGATVAETLTNVFALHADHECLGMRLPMPTWPSDIYQDGTAAATAADDCGAPLSDRFFFLRFEQVWRAAHNFGSGLRRVSGLQPGYCVALAAANSFEWFVVDLACTLYGWLLAPLHTCWDAPTLQTALEKTGARVVVSDHAALLISTIDVSGITTVAIGPQFRHAAAIKNGVWPPALSGDANSMLCNQSVSCGVASNESFGATSAEPNYEAGRLNGGPAVNYPCLCFDYICTAGSIHPLDPTPQTNPNDRFAIMFTSGSTGTPKAVVFTNERYNKKICRAAFVVTGHTSLSFEPLAHSSRSNSLAAFIQRARIGVWSRVPEKLFEDVRVLEPTLFDAVPRVFAELKADYDRMLVAVHKLAAGDKNGRTLPPEAVEFICMQKFKPRLGNRLEALVTGGAPVAPSLLKWLEQCFVVPVSVTYGATECSGISHDGVLSPGTEIKLLDWEEYRTSDKPFPRGELCVKHDFMANGYLDDHDANVAFTADGFFRTGDIVELLEGRLSSDGRRQRPRVRIVDRRKNLFKLAQGEYVSPERVEYALRQSLFVHQIFVHGEGTETCVVAIVVLKASSPSVPAPTENEVLRDLARLAGDASLQPYEIPQAVHLISSSSPFSTANGLLTATNKLNRLRIRKRFAAELLQCYDRARVKLAAMTARFDDAVQAILVGDGNAASALLNADFLSLGGDSLQAARLQRSLRDKFGVNLSLRAIMSAHSLNDLVPLLTQPGAQHTVHASRATVSTMLSDVSGDHGVLHHRQGTREAKAGSNVWPPPLGDDSVTVLLSGATGFVGIYLLREILQRTAWSALCLVRAASEAHARERIHAAAIATEQSNLRWFDEARITFLVGDLMKVGALAAARGGQIAAVFHNAAVVNHARTYEQLREMNVVGTAEMLALAERNDIPFFFISTLSSLSCEVGGLGLEEDAALTGERLAEASGYAQTKWVCEQLIRRRCRPLGGARAVVLRLGTITGATATGHANTSDFVHAFLCAMVLLGVAPSIDDAGGVVELHPVDCAASTIFTASLAGCWGKTCHVSAVARSVGLKRLVNLIRSIGYTVESCTFKDWYASLETIAMQTAEKGLLSPKQFALLRFVLSYMAGTDRYVGKRKIIVETNTNAAVGSTGHDRSVGVDDKLIRLYLNFYQAEGLIPMPTEQAQ
eukprot:SAG31_NODE_119_length_23948_cov_9.957105_8_plen_1292_part_00